MSTVDCSSPYSDYLALSQTNNNKPQMAVRLYPQLDYDRSTQRLSKSINPSSSLSTEDLKRMGAIELVNHFLDRIAFSSYSAAMLEKNVKTLSSSEFDLAEKEIKKKFENFLASISVFVKIFTPFAKKNGKPFDEFVEHLNNWTKILERKIQGLQLKKYNRNPSFTQHVGKVFNSILHDMFYIREIDNFPLFESANPLLLDGLLIFTPPFEKPIISPLHSLLSRINKIRFLFKTKIQKITENKENEPGSMLQNLQPLSIKGSKDAEIESLSRIILSGHSVQPSRSLVQSNYPQLNFESLVQYSYLPSAPPLEEEDPKKSTRETLQESVEYITESFYGYKEYHETLLKMPYEEAIKTAKEIKGKLKEFDQLFAKEMELIATLTFEKESSLFSSVSGFYNELVIWNQLIQRALDVVKEGPLKDLKRKVDKPESLSRSIYKDHLESSKNWIEEILLLGYIEEINASLKNQIE